MAGVGAQQGWEHAVEMRAPSYQPFDWPMLGQNPVGASLTQHLHARKSATACLLMFEA